MWLEAPEAKMPQGLRQLYPREALVEGGAEAQGDEAAQVRVLQGLIEVTSARWGCFACLVVELFVNFAITLQINMEPKVQKAGCSRDLE